MRIRFLLLLLCYSFRSDDLSDCSKYLLSGSVIGIVNGKCLMISKTTMAADTACRAVGPSLDKLSIDDIEENDVIQDLLLDNNVTKAYIGLSLDESGTWSWENSTSEFRNWEVPPFAVSTTTSQPIRSTLPPAEQRRSTAIVIGIDASLYSTNAWTFAQIDFAASLADYISARGSSEFAIFAYGCTQISPYIVQFPTFVSSYDQVLQMIGNLNETILHDCVRENPLDFSTMFNYQQWTYFNRYNTSPRPFKSQYISMIYFSASSDSNDINIAKKLYTMPDSSVITISVGSQAGSLSNLSIPVQTNWLKVTTADEIRKLVPTIDNLIFGIKAGSKSEVAAPQVLATSIDCAYMDSSNGKWYPNGDCTTKLTMLCQYVLIPKEPVTTKSPADSWSDPCYTESSNFKFYSELGNSKCYKVSSAAQNFATSTNLCLGNSETYQNEPILTSIMSEKEEGKLNDLVKDFKEGMFWIGLRKIAGTWKFLNGDVMTYINWRAGYPKTADGCDCVAYVTVDQKWINTDCNIKMYSICAFEFNATLYQGTL